MKYEFNMPPRLGTVLSYDGQPYRLARKQPYTRKTDGAPTVLLIWVSQCATCNTPFEMVTGLKIRGFNRRCEKHKAPRKRVNPQRKSSQGRKK